MLLEPLYINKEYLFMVIFKMLLEWDLLLRAEPLERQLTVILGVDEVPMKKPTKKVSHRFTLQWILALYS